MTLRQRIERAVYNVINGYDFEEKVTEVLDDICFEDIVFDAVNSKIAKLDFESVIRECVEGMVDDIVDENEASIYDAIADAMEVDTL